MDKFTIELIDRYLNGELKDKEFLDFQKQISIDKDLAREVRLHKEINEALRENDIMKLRQQLLSIHEQYSRQNRNRIIHLISNNRYMATGVAAAIITLLVIGSILIFNKGRSLDQDSLFSKYYESEEAVMLSRSGISNSDDMLIKDALLLYHEKNYEAAIELLSKTKENILSSFYLGLSYLETGKIAESKELFQKIIDHNDNLFIEQAEWYLGLCYLKTKQTEEAREVFTRISKSNSIYKTRAGEILKSI